MKRTELLAVACIIFFGWLVYLNSLPNPFIWDDLALVNSNLHIRDLAGIPKLFTETVYHQEMIGRFYRPVLMASFALNYRLWGLNPFGYHLSNIFIHMSNALLIYGIIALIFRKRLLAFLTAMFFVLHPIHTEAVTYISGRADPLSAFFCLMSLYFFIRYVDFEGVGRRLYFGASALSYIFGVMTKESSIVLPLLFIFYETCFRPEELKGRRAAKYAVFPAVLLSYGVIRHYALINVAGGYLTNSLLPLIDRLYTVPPVILAYLKLLLFPERLHMERGDFLFGIPASFFEPRVLSAVLLLMVFSLFAWRTRKRSREILFGFGWFFILLLPVLNIFPVNAFVAEHWLYIPSVGFFIVISTALMKLSAFNPIKPFIAGFIIIAFTMLGLSTIKQNYIWRDPVSFYMYTIKLSPWSYRLRNNLGDEYFRLGLYKKAETKFREVIASRPPASYAAYDYLNLGSVLFRQGKKEEAIEAYGRSLQINPDFSQGYWCIGNIYYQEREMKNAIVSYKKAVELSPSDAYYRHSLGNAYLNDGQYRQAEESYNKTLQLSPNIFEARVNLGTAYFKQGMLKEAFAEYKKATDINPESTELKAILEKIRTHLIDK